MYRDPETTEIHRLIDEFIREVATRHRREEYKHTLQKARKLVERVDPADTPFVALAMHLNIPLWTGDKALIRLGLETGEYIAVDTEGVELLLRGELLGSILERMKEKYLK